MRNFDWQIADPMRGIDQKVYGVYLQSNMNLAALPRYDDMAQYSPVIRRESVQRDSAGMLRPPPPGRSSSSPSEVH